VLLCSPSARTVPPSGVPGSCPPPQKRGAALLAVLAILALIGINLVSVLSLTVSQEAGPRVCALWCGWAPLQGLGALCAVLTFSVGIAVTHFRTDPRKALWAVAAASVIVLCLAETVRALAAIDGMAHAAGGLQPVLSGSGLIVALLLALVLEAILLARLLCAHRTLLWSRGGQESPRGPQGGGVPAPLAVPVRQEPQPAVVVARSRAAVPVARGTIEGG
jgi:hypothetical protein